MWESILYYDAYLGHLINQTGSEKQDIFWVIITNTYSWIPFFLFLIYVNFKWFGKKKGSWVVAHTLLTFACIGLITNIIKKIVQRILPIYHETFCELFRFTAHADGYSFFSGHTSNSLAISMFLFLIFRNQTKYAFFVFIWPVLFAYSRLYLGVHYPLDILFGAIAGVIVAFVNYRIFNKYHPNFTRIEVLPPDSVEKL